MTQKSSHVSFVSDEVSNGNLAILKEKFSMEFGQPVTNSFVIRTVLQRAPEDVQRQESSK